MSKKALSPESTRVEAESVDTKTMVMRLHLEAFVPLMIQEIIASGGITEEHLARAGAYAWDIAGGGDILMYRSNKRGESAKLMGKLVEGIAILSFCPGGITFLGLHFEVPAPKEVLAC